MHNKQVPQLNVYDSLFYAYIENIKPKLVPNIVRLISAPEAEKVVQNAFSKLYHIALNQPSFYTKYQSLLAFARLLFSIMKNLALSRLKHQQVV